MLFGLFQTKRQKEDDEKDEEYIVLREATQKEVERLKELKAKKVAKEQQELVKFRKVIKEYGPDAIYFLAFGGEDRSK